MFCEQNQELFVGLREIIFRYISLNTIFFGVKLRTAVFRIAIALCLFGISTVKLYAGGEPAGFPTIKQRQDCELWVTKGIAKSNAGLLSEAEALHRKALEQ